MCADGRRRRAVGRRYRQTRRVDRETRRERARAIVGDEQRIMVGQGVGQVAGPAGKLVAGAGRGAHGQRRARVLPAVGGADRAGPVVGDGEPELRFPEPCNGGIVGHCDDRGDIGCAHHRDAAGAAPAVADKLGKRTVGLRRTGDEAGEVAAARNGVPAAGRGGRAVATIHAQRVLVQAELGAECVVGQDVDETDRIGHADGNAVNQHIGNPVAGGRNNSELLVGAVGDLDVAAGRDGAVAVGCGGDGEIDHAEMRGDGARAVHGQRDGRAVGLVGRHIAGPAGEAPAEVGGSDNSDAGARCMPGDFRDIEHAVGVRARDQAIIGAPVPRDRGVVGEGENGGDVGRADGGRRARSGPSGADPAHAGGFHQRVHLAPQAGGPADPVGAGRRHGGAIGGGHDQGEPVNFEQRVDRAIVGDAGEGVGICRAD